MYTVAYRGNYYTVDVRETQTQIIEKDRMSMIDDMIQVEDVVVAFGETLEDALYALLVPENDFYLFVR